MVGRTLGTACLHLGIALLFIANAVAASAGAENASDSALKDELRSLKERIEQLETQLEDAGPAIEPGSTEQASLKRPRLRFDGDARYRAEAIDADSAGDLDRQRFRARAGVSATVLDSVDTHLRLSTGEGDPRSAHITFSGGYSRKSIGVDLAYVNWKVTPETHLQVGKLPYPNWRPAESVFVGGDFNPEGWVSTFSLPSGWFGNAHGFWLRSGQSGGDAQQSGAQFGYSSKAEGPVVWSAALAYTDFTGVRGALPFLDGMNAFGNSTTQSGAFASDFDIAELSAELKWTGYAGWVGMFGHVARNVAAERYDAAEAIGIAAGSSHRGAQWHASYQYASIAKDALFGQLMDGDFGGGATDTRGHMFRLGFSPAVRVSAVLTYFHNDTRVSLPAPDRFKLLQLDLNFAY